MSPPGKIPRHGDFDGLARSVDDQCERNWRHLDGAGMTLKLRCSVSHVHYPACERVKTQQIPWASPDCHFIHTFVVCTSHWGFRGCQASTNAAGKPLLFPTTTFMGGLMTTI